MDSQKVISEAWKLTWNRKYLWIFGFIAALTYGSEDVGVSVTQSGAWLLQSFGNILSAQGITTILGVVIAILLWLLGVIARTALIQDISIGGTKAEKLWLKAKNLVQFSIPSLGSIVLMQLLVWSPIIVANILLFIGTKPLTESFTSSFNAGEFPEFDFFSFGVIWLLGMSVFLLTIPLLFIDAFSYRSIVIESLGVVDGIRKAWAIIRENIKPILGLAVLCVIIGIVFSFAVSLLLSPLLFAMMPLMRQVLVECTSDSGDFGAMTECMQNLNQQPLFIGLSLLSGIISAAVSSVWVAFQSAAFTLAYVKLTKSD